MGRIFIVFGVLAILNAVTERLQGSVSGFSSVDLISLEKYVRECISVAMLAQGTANTAMTSVDGLESDNDLTFDEVMKSKK